MLVWAAGFFGLVAASLGAAPQSGVKEIPLWPGVAPGSEPEKLPARDYVEVWSGPERAKGRETVKNIAQPTLAIFPANPAKARGGALIIAPGGGYNLVAINHEGWAVARRLADEGVACFVLKYRHFDQAIALRDAHRAIRLVRSRAGEWKVDPRRIGFGGFSAGGHLATNAAGNRMPPQPWTTDAIDAVSNQIDYLMLIYPGGLARLPAEAVIDGGFPPTFLVNAAGDDVHLRAMPLLNRLVELRLRFEAHVFAAGRHGEGMYETVPSTSAWPRLFLAWLDEQLEPTGGIKPAALPPK